MIPSVFNLFGNVEVLLIGQHLKIHLFHELGKIGLEQPSATLSLEQHLNIPVLNLNVHWEKM